MIVMKEKNIPPDARRHGQSHTRSLLFWLELFYKGKKISRTVKKSDKMTTGTGDNSLNKMVPRFGYELCKSRAYLS